MSDIKQIGQYRLGDCVGKGAFGSVYRALNKDNGEIVAIKQLKLADMPKAEISSIMLEIDLLKKLNHNNIVKYIGFIKTSDFLYIVLEFCEGSLLSTLKKFGSVSENLLAVYVYQTLDGLNYLHEQGVVHRDLKAANLLTTKEATIKLADFGVAKQTGDSSDDNQIAGSPYWMAPEVIEMTSSGTASDIWSLGCTIIELLTGSPPYFGLAPMAALFKIVQEDHPPLPEDISPALYDFLMECFQRDYNLRIGAKKLMKHQWLNAVRPKELPVVEVMQAKQAVKQQVKEEDDFDLGGLDLEAKLRKRMQQTDDDEDFDPFEVMEDEFQVKDVRAKASQEIADILNRKLKDIDQQAKVLPRLLQLITDQDLQADIASNSGIVPLMSILSNSKSPDVQIVLLKLFIRLATVPEILENFCYLGGVSLISRFIQDKYSMECRQLACQFIQRLISTNSTTRHSFVTCRGLEQLSNLLGQNYGQSKQLIQVAIEGLHTLLEDPFMPKNEFCILLIGHEVPLKLTELLVEFLYDSQPITQILEVLNVFSRSSLRVKESMASLQVLTIWMSIVDRMQSSDQLIMIRSLRNLSALPAVLDVLQEIDACSELSRLLSVHDGKYYSEIRNQTLFVLFNFCRVNRVRQLVAASTGVIPQLVHIVAINNPLKQFALPILCDFAHGSVEVQKYLWQNNVLAFYISLLSDPNSYWQVSALDAIVAWMQDDQEVEKQLVQSVDVVQGLLVNAKPSVMISLLPVYQKLLNISQALPRFITKAPVMQKLVDSLSHRDVGVQLSLLKILMTILKSSSRPQLLMMTYDVEASLQPLLVSKTTPILVREIAHKILELAV